VWLTDCDIRWVTCAISYTQELTSMQGLLGQTARYIVWCQGFPSQCTKSSGCIDTNLRRSWDCICNVDWESFTPLVFLTFGGLNKEANITIAVWQIFYHRSTIFLTIRYYSLGCVVLYHFLYYVLLYWSFMGPIHCSQQSSLLSPMSFV